MHEVLVNCLGGLSLPWKSVVRLTDRPDMTLDVYHGRKTTTQQQHNNNTTFHKFFLGFFDFYGGPNEEMQHLFKCVKNL